MQADMSCTLRASVVTGLEFLAADEVKERLSVPEVLEGRGFITWSQDIETVTQVCSMQSFGLKFLLISFCKCALHPILFVGFKFENY